MRYLLLCWSSADFFDRQVMHAIYGQQAKFQNGMHYVIRVRVIILVEPQCPRPPWALLTLKQRTTPTHPRQLQTKEIIARQVPYDKNPLLMNWPRLRFFEIFGANKIKILRILEKSRCLACDSLENWPIVNYPSPSQFIKSEFLW